MYDIIAQNQDIILASLCLIKKKRLEKFSWAADFFSPITTAER